VGGSLVLASTCLVSWSSSRREKQQAAQARQSKATASGVAASSERRALEEVDAEQGAGQANLPAARSSWPAGLSTPQQAGQAQQQGEHGAAEMDAGLHHSHQQHSHPGRPPDVP
jgi:hypothetical protein